MAKLIKSDGSTVEVTPKSKKRGFTLEELRHLVGCKWVEVAYLTDGSGRFFVVDEEGKLNGKERNEEATKLYGRAPYDYIVGDALLCEQGEVL